MKHTKIQWTERTWNPVRGCSRVSKGCEHCYAETVAHRFSGPGMPYEGLTVVNQSTGEPRWNGTVNLVTEHLLDPLKWQKPRMIFVNSMSDVFHEAVPDEYIDRMFAVMALASRHTFQILTKRPERMRSYFGSSRAQLDYRTEMIGIEAESISGWDRYTNDMRPRWTLPLPNVGLGVSVEDQKTADERIPLLLQTPAAIRWISAEPLLGSIQLSWSECQYHCRNFVETHNGEEYCQACAEDGGTGELGEATWLDPGGLDWVVVGGESGPKARPFNVDWARSIVKQCEDAGVACFVKQLGAVPVMGASEWHELAEYGRAPLLNASNKDKVTNDTLPLKFEDKKGGNPLEWPEDLRVRKYPTTQTVADERRK